MRIIAGEKRGQVIDAPEGLDTRPTTDRVRESIMSSVYSLCGGFEGLHVLDAFAGSGAMGLEAMSRGAETCILNDFALRSRTVIEANRDKLKYTPERVKITSTDILRSGFPVSGSAFDLVFLDPPYKTLPEEVMQVLQAANTRGQLSDDCLVVYEHANVLAESVPEAYGFRVISQKKYGKTHVTYLRSRL